MTFESNIKVLLTLASLISLWAPIHIMNKFALDNFSPQLVALLRWSGVSFILWSLLFIKRFRSLLGIKYSDLYGSRSAVLIGLIFLGPAHAVGSYAYQHTTSIEASVLATSGPVWTTVMALIFLKEKISIVRGIAILLGIAGAYVITLGIGVPQLNSSSVVGNSLFLVYIFLEGCALIYAKKFLSQVHGVTIVAWQAIGIALSLFLSSLIFPTHCFLNCHHVNLAGLLAMFYLIFVAGIFCFTLWYMIAQKASISLMAVTGGVEPLVGTILGVTFLKEKLTAQIIVGMLFVIASIAVGAKDGQKSPS